MAELIRLNQNVNKNLLGFIPSIIIEEFLASKRKVFQFPFKTSLKTVIMFADISGFTALSEALQVKGHEGAEILAFALNRYMELLVSSIGRSGGDIFKFAGDAMIVLWPPPNAQNPEKFEKRLTKLCRGAIQSALDIQSKLHNMDIVSGIKLSVKIGFGVGDVSIIHVGGVHNRAEFLPAGDPLIQAFEAEHHATKGGVVHISNAVYERVKGYFATEELIEHLEKGEHKSPNAPFYNVLKIVGRPVKYRGDALMIKTKIPLSDLNQVRKEMMQYVPKALLDYMLVDQEKWASEIRRVSTMFVNLGIDLRDAKTEEGLHRIQKVIEIVQKVIYQNEGSLNKLLMDDKGSTLIVIFGLHPVSHQNDATRAVLAGINIIKELKKIDCKSAIGVTSGQVFAGVVGTSGSRREFSILGDSVNLSARFMQAACRNETKKLFVDEATRKDSAQSLGYRFVMKENVKGKQGLISFYEPIDPESFSPPFINNVQELRVHKDGDSDKFDSLVCGRSADIARINIFMDGFLKKPATNRGMIVIAGEYGVGKSVLTKMILERTQELKKKNTSIVISMPNSFSALRKFNGMRILVKKILCQLMFENEKLGSMEDAIKHIISDIVNRFEKSTDKYLNSLYLLNDILDCNFPNGSPSELNSTSRNEILIQKQEEKSPKIEKLISKYLYFIIKYYVKDQSKFNLDESSHSDIIENENEQSIILVLENFEIFDKNSVSCLKLLVQRITRICVFCVMKTNYLEASGKHIYGFLKECEQMLSERYVYHHLSELDEVRTLDLIKLITRSKYVHEELAEHLIKMTSGNPFEIVSVLESYDHEWMAVDNKSLIPTKKFEHFYKLGEFLQVTVPNSFYKKNGSIADKIPVDAMLILKSACVIGHIFDFKMLQFVNPFKDEFAVREVKKILDDLVTHDFLEILDESTTNITYRFSSPYLREVIYHRLLYSHRRFLHSYVGNAMLSSNLVSIYRNDSMSESEEIEIESNLLAYHYCIAEDVKDKPTVEILKKSRRGAIVKKIMKKYGKMANMSQDFVLKEGFCERQSGRKLAWNTRYLVVTPSYFRYYTTKNHYLEDKDNFSISLKYQALNYIIEPQNAKSLTNLNQFDKEFGFMIHAGTYSKNGKEKKNREFYFATKNKAEVEEWMTFIEFAKTKCIYEDFVLLFGKIEFPLVSDNGNTPDSELNLDEQSSQNNNMILYNLSNFSIPASGSRWRRSTFSNPKNNHKTEMLPISTLETGQKEGIRKLIIQFYSGTFLLFLTHLIDKNPNLLEISNFEKFGDNNGALTRFPNLFRMDSQFLKFKKSTLQFAVESKQLDSLLMSSQTIISDKTNKEGSSSKKNSTNLNKEDFKQ